MTDTSQDDLTYGHFGECIYDTESNLWTWKRTLGSSLSLHPLGSHTLAVPPPKPVEYGRQSAQPETRTSRSLRRAHQEDFVIRASPDLAPALDLLQLNEKVSEKVESITARHDPRTGNCLATGRIFDELMHRSTSVVAFPGSASRTVLRLVQMRDQKQGWERDKSIWLEVPQIQGESGSWDMGSPVQQILFSNDQDDGRQYLAVRTSTATSVFRPILRRHSMAGQDSDNPSRLALDPVAFVASGHAASSAHADIAFNPWYPKQFAVIDQSANWTIFDCAWDPKQSAAKMPVEVCRGGAVDNVTDAFNGGGFLLDGWSRIAWVTNLSTIVTCSRRTITIYDVSSTPVLLSSLLVGETILVLDLQRDPRRTDRLYVLTTKHLICLCIEVPDDSRVRRKQQSSIRSLLRIRHFRDLGDMSLQIHVLSDQDDAIVLIRSSLNEVITSHRFRTSQESSLDVVTASDSALLPLPTSGKVSPQQSVILDILLEPLNYGESSTVVRDRLESSRPGLVYRQKNIKFWIATVLLNNLSVVQQLYYDVVGVHEGLDIARSVTAPNWRSRLPQSTSRLEVESFVVQDLSDKTEPQSNFRQSLQPPQSKHDDGLRVSQAWTVNYDCVYSVIAEASDKDTQDVSRVLQKAQFALNGDDPSDHPWRLLSHLAEAELAVNELEDASTALHDLVSSTPSYDRPSNATRDAPALTIARLTDVDVICPAEQSDDGEVLVSVYDNIVSHWLAPVSLSQQIPARVRLAKEQLVRRVAADITLSSYCIKQVGPPDIDQLASSPSMAQDMDSERPPGALAYLQPRSSLPTPSPTATPSLASGSLSSHPTSLASPEHSRLSRYTSFANPEKPPSALPKSLSNALAHWKIGEDPTKYDWLAIKNAQDLEAEYDEQELTAKERARLKRKAERHLERQRKESAAAASQGLASSQAPVIVSASQPIASDRRLDGGTSQPLVLLGSSSQVRGQSQSQSQLGMASQIEPGRFGGRAPLKKKRRTMGF